ncbi:hypothetical protein B0T24DRAFT_680175 [Lasiosphaeria ovina]|uniref:Uncharacterized protein n=1 Tax=Lasiosphaeria ovina TaxID=92902 RepID=A0AAE0K6N1_9PEZI|nr:hypothetical protein B0T24DRAFT_680175 [Lasiosphaeria ovina]
MARLSALIGAAALFTGILAFEPVPQAARGFIHCGSALIGRYNAYAPSELATFTNFTWDVYQTLYPVLDDGEADQPVGWCEGATCVDPADNANAFCAS